MEKKLLIDATLSWITPVGNSSNISQRHLDASEDILVNTVTFVFTGICIILGLLGNSVSIIVFLQSKVSESTSTVRSVYNTFWNWLRIIFSLRFGFYFESSSPTSHGKSYCIVMHVYYYLMRARMTVLVFLAFVMVQYVSIQDIYVPWKVGDELPK